MPASSQSAPVWPGVVDETGRLHLDAHAPFQAYVRTLKLTQVDVIVRKHVKHRTPPQVAYYFSTVIPELAAHLGYRRDEYYQLHDGLMHKFWPLEPRVCKVSGVLIPRRRRLTLKEAGTEPPLSDEEMSEHIDHSIIYAAEDGCVISEPRPKVQPQKQLAAKAA